MFFTIAQLHLCKGKVMRSLFSLSAIAGALIVVAGCELDITSDVYVSDLRDVATNNTEGLTTPATIAIQIPSMDKCDEYSEKLIEIMRGILLEFTPKTCERDGMTSYLLSDTQVPLLGSEKSWRQSSSLFGILAEAQDDGDILVTVANNSDKFRVLNERVDGEFHQSIDLAESEIILVLNNDEREPITYLVGGVFLNGQPIYYDEEFSLKRRHTAEIKLSNVGAAYLEKNEYATPLVLVDQSSNPESN